MKGLRPHFLSWCHASFPCHLFKAQPAYLSVDRLLLSVGSAGHPSPARLGSAYFYSFTWQLSAESPSRVTK